MSDTLARLGVSAADVPDARQEVLCVISAHLDGFVWKESPSDGDPLRGWVYVICLKMASQFRRARQRATRRTTLLEDMGEVPSSSPEVDLLVALRREVDVLRSLIDALAPPRRAVLVAYLCEERTMVEIAAQLAIPESTAWTRLYHAIADLQEAYRRLGRRRREDAVVWLWPVLFDGAFDRVASNANEGSAMPAPARGRSVGRFLAVAALLVTAVAAFDVPLTLLHLDAPLASAATQVAPPASAPPSPAALTDPFFDAKEGATSALPLPRAPSVREGKRPPTTGGGRLSSPPATGGGRFSSPPPRDERAFLAKTQEALAAGRLEDARAALAAHRRKFPHGALADLRERLAGKLERVVMSP